jgi:hypothetical protein
VSPAVSVGVKKCEGPETIDVLAKVKYTVTEFNGTPTADQKKSVNWVVNINGEERKKFEKAGEILEFEVPDTWAGDEIIVHPYINKPSPELKVATKVGPYFLFDGKELIMYSIKCQKVISWPASSGAENITDEKAMNGPIPQGKFIVEKVHIESLYDEKKRPKVDGWKGGVDSWGSQRIQIFAYGTKTGNRRLFYIHGGKKQHTDFGITLTEKIDDFVSLIKAWKRDSIVLVVKTTLNSNSHDCPSKEDFLIDWAFIAEREGTRNDMYVPVDKNGNVLGVSGPTIASGFDLGQTDLNGLKAYAFDPSLENKLKDYVSLKGSNAKEYVNAHPLHLSDVEITTVNKKVKHAYALKAEKFYNEVAVVSKIISC